MTPTIVFSHANGFPAGTYRRIFEAWRAAGYRVEAIEKVGHDPRWPVTSNWPHLRDQLLAFVHERADGPVFLVGHSLGGFLSLLAATRRPEIARGIVLLDSPVIHGWRAKMLQLGKVTGLGARFSPGVVSKKRREHWPGRDAALAHFRGKAAFARWDPQVLEDYIDTGTEATETADAAGKAPGGRRLAFHRDTETRIYNSLPHHLPRLLRTHPLRCPVAFVAGTQSEELRRAGLGGTRRLVGERLSWVAGSHLFPMEKPAETAGEVLRILSNMGGRAA
jgi:pimeloyl-ACP methyl ester carboxylesterase